MGRPVRITLFVIGAALIIFNLFTLDYSDLWSEDSQVSWIGVAAGICSVLIVWINGMSLKVQDEIHKAHNRNRQGAEEDAPQKEDL